ncbi:MAG: metallophosphoesterase family protein [Elusimicrobia bacterium]|nr:metallophosphoesterase family protein [Elusimicrobiota bacterium]MDE2424579.1 metallophosphoesterase family protein [Elusimicrobiota bacterium]
MIYGVFSDVHSNVEAFDVVLDYFKDLGVDGYICCGDLVGYGPQPNEVVERVRALSNAYVICGNHDLAAIGRLEVEWFNPYARAAALWTRERLSEASRGYLGGLAAKLEADGFTLAHGTPRRPPEEYLLSSAQFRANIELVRRWPLFVGHSHMPLCFRVRKDAKGGVESLLLEASQTVEAARGPDGGRAPTAFNPGSVGQPRDQDSRACCAVFDSEELTFRIARLEYDVAAVQSKIREAGLPEFLALRLAFGQ